MADTVLGTCKHVTEPHADCGRNEWSPVTEPIPPLLLQAYRALTDSRNYTPGPSVEAAIAAIEAEYPSVKEKA